MLPMMIQVEVPELVCVRCQRREAIMPAEVRRDPHGYAAPVEQREWQVSAWSSPRNWRRWTWPNGAEGAACSDCWPAVEHRTAAFIESLAAKS